MNDKRFCYIEPLNCIYDMETDTMYFLDDIKNICALLDLINKQISDLQHRLEVSERATKLACKRLQDDYCINCDNQTNCSKVETCERALSVYLPSGFKEQAEKELKGE